MKNSLKRLFVLVIPSTRLTENQQAKKKKEKKKTTSKNKVIKEILQERKHS